MCTVSSAPGGSRHYRIDLARWRRSACADLSPLAQQRSGVPAGMLLASRGVNVLLWVAPAFTGRVVRLVLLVRCRDRASLPDGYAVLLLDECLIAPSGPSAVEASGGVGAVRVLDSVAKWVWFGQSDRGSGSGVGAVTGWQIFGRDDLGCRRVG